MYECISNIASPTWHICNILQILSKSFMMMRILSSIFNHAGIFQRNFIFTDSHIPWTRCTNLKLPPRFNKMQDYRQLFTCDKKKNASIQDFRLYKLSEQSKSDNAGNARRFCNLPHLVITGYILGSLQRLNDSIRPFEN